MNKIYRTMICSIYLSLGKKYILEENHKHIESINLIK